MKTYEPRRNNECPNGLHPAYDPAKDPSLNECTCPWLIIQSSTPVQHLTSWNRRETENFIREVDRGYFDPPGYPKRTGSMFLSPAMQRLLDVAEKEPVAAALTLLAGSGSGLPPFDAIAWDAEDAVLSLRVGASGGWWYLFLGSSGVEAVTNHQGGDTAGDAHAAGANPVLLWADHPDTWDEIDLPHEPIASPRGTSDDVFAEDITGTALQPTPLPKDYFAQEYSENPAYDAAIAAAEDMADRIRAQRVSVGHEEMTETEKRLHVNPELVEQIERAINEPSSRVRRERPLPQRVPQLPSDIAEAGHGDYCTCDLNLRYTCPTCRAAQADACTCAIRGSAPDTYACPEHSADARCAVPVRVLYPGDDINISTAYCEKAANHGDVHAGGGFAWSYDELEITGPKPRHAPDVID